MKQYCLEVTQKEGTIVLRFPHDEIRGELLKLISKHKPSHKDEGLTVAIVDKETPQY